MKKPIFDKDILEVYLGRIFEYSADEYGTIEFMTEYGHDDFYNVIVSEDSIFLPNGGTVGGYDLEKEIDDIDDLIEALDNFPSEDYGWEII